MMFSDDLINGGKARVSEDLTEVCRDILRPAGGYGDNRDYVHVSVVERIHDVLNDPTVHDFTKDVIRTGLTKDSLDAVRDTELALELLKEVLSGL